jgi:Thioredoxin-like
LTSHQSGSSGRLTPHHSSVTPANTKGKLIMVDFYTRTCGWRKRLDADVFPKPAVIEAMRRFVPVKVDAEDGEGRPLASRYGTHIRQMYPTIFFIDPAAEATAATRSWARSRASCRRHRSPIGCG